MVRVAPPALTVPEPRLVLPSQNVTEPVGEPASGATTVMAAERVTGWPYVDGLGKDDLAVAASAFSTTWFNTAEVLYLKFVSPLYLVVMECDPANRAVVVIVACRLAFTGEEPMLFTPS